MSTSQYQMTRFTHEPHKHAISLPYTHFIQFMMGCTHDAANRNERYINYISLKHCNFSAAINVEHCNISIARSPALIIRSITPNKRFFDDNKRLLGVNNSQRGHLCVGRRTSELVALVNRKGVIGATLAGTCDLRRHFTAS